MVLLSFDFSRLATNNEFSCAPPSTTAISPRLCFDLTRSVHGATVLSEPAGSTLFSPVPAVSTTFAFLLFYLFLLSSSILLPLST